MHGITQPDGHPAVDGSKLRSNFLLFVDQSLPNYPRM